MAVSFLASQRASPVGGVGQGKQEAVHPVTVRAVGAFSVATVAWFSPYLAFIAEVPRRWVIVLAALLCILTRAWAAAEQVTEVDDMRRAERLQTLAARLRLGREHLVFPTRKKLIQVNGRTPSPRYARDHVREMERSPFDGIVLHLHESRLFHPQAFDEKDFLSEYEDLAAINWGTFTDNFIWTVCNADLDWFDEQQWQNVLHNTRLFARAALFGRCAGIVFDPEDYGQPVFSYQAAKHRDTKSFGEYGARVRHCGEEWIRAVQEELPHARILDLWLTEAFITGDDRLLWSGALRPEEVRPKLPGYGYGLLSDFVNGMLAGAAPETRIIDGNEGAYYYESQAEYAGFRRFSQELLAPAYIDPDLREKYRTQVQPGSSYYDGYCYGEFRRTPAGHLTTREQARWLEHNVYWALKSTDEYVWEWAQSSNWWTGDLLPGYENAVRSACRKVKAGEPLGFDMSSVFDAMLQREAARRPVSRAPRLLGANPAALDGKAEGPLWDQMAALSAFEPMLDWNIPARTTAARVGYDDHALCVTVRCDEPDPGRMWLRAGTHDAPWIIWDDNVEILIASPGATFPVHQFILNAAGSTLDAVYAARDSRQDLSYGPDWEGRAYMGNDFWSATIVIPWAALGRQAPRPGDELPVNVTRYRSQGPEGEKSSWSPALRSEDVFPRFGKARVDPRSFGTLVMD